MKWLFENGCPWNRETFTRAISHGNLEILKWLKINKCPSLDFKYYYSSNLEILEWLKQSET
jgi:hypothetical protein